MTIPEQIRVALDGRTQRWLSMEVKIPEDTLSKKMNNIAIFTDEELKLIQDRLKFTVH